MPTIIKNKTITDSPFELVDAESADIRANNVLLPLAVFLENSAAIKGRNDIGVWIDAGEDVEDIEAVANQLPIIALNFPAFGDGRAYSSANILRRKFGYKGEIRAVGDVRRDQLEQMLSCGINAFDMAEGQDLEQSLDGLKHFSHNYQGTIDRPEPLFRHRE